MIVNGVFTIKGRGRVVTCECTEELELGQEVYDQAGHILIGTISGLEYTNRCSNIGIVLRGAQDSKLSEGMEIYVV